MLYWAIGASFVVYYLAQKYLVFRRDVASFRGHPGFRYAFSTLGVFGNFVPPMRGIAMGWDSTWRLKHDNFAECGWDGITVVTAWPRRRFVYLADPQAIKEVGGLRARYPKPTKSYTALAFFGENIIITEGETWKRHRKLAVPAFSERNNQFVFDSTTRLVNEMFETWGDKKFIKHKHVPEMTLALTLLIINAAGFGRDVHWASEEVVPPGHKISFQECLHFVSRDILVKVAAPKWSLGLTQRLRECRLGFDELDQYLREMIKERRESGSCSERNDVFSNLLQASDDASTGGQGLSESELLGNTFFFVIAGHETTGHTLAYLFTLLALYPAEQEKLYNHCITVLDGRDGFDYTDVHHLTHSAAVVNETLRMFAPVALVPKRTEEATVLSVGRASKTLLGDKTADERRSIAIPADGRVLIDLPAVHYNPKYWENPFDFNPDRFLKPYNRDAFIPFSTGARACIGRRFAETEAIAIVSAMIVKYKIHMDEELMPTIPGEHHLARRNRIMKTSTGLSMTGVHLPLIFERR